MLTEELENQLSAVKHVLPSPDEECPEVYDWSQAEQGKFYRPIKKQITIRLDADMLHWFQQQQGKYQRLINQACREYMQRHSLVTH